MKQLSCDMCGSTNVIKEDGLFVCQTCGTKYSVEEARKMMMEGTVEVEGTVKIDQSQELENLYEIARRAKSMSDSKNALSYYNQILVKNPNSWEAQFYVLYYKALREDSSPLNNGLDLVLDLIKTNVEEDNQKKAILEIFDKLNSMSRAPLLNRLGNLIEENFSGDFYLISIDAWKQGININKNLYDNLPFKKPHEKAIQKYALKIRKYENDYVSPLEKRHIEVNTSKFPLFVSPLEKRHIEVNTSKFHLFPRCPFCNTKLDPKDIKFCTECGARVNK